MRNHYFNPYPSNITQEQLLIEDLVIESIKIYGHDCYYLPRESRDQIDKLMGEDALKTFPSAFPIEFYLENVFNFDGDNDIMTKFGLEIHDEITLLLSRRRFKKEVPNLVRPREGDIIYIPLVANFFEIIGVEHEDKQAMFYTLGKGRNSNVYVYALKLRQYVFSEEPIQTGVEEVDEQIRDTYRPLRLTMSVGGSGDYDFINQEIVYQGSDLANANVTANVFTWSPQDRELDVISVIGTFTPTLVVKGASSNAQWILASTDSDSPLDEMNEEVADNKTVQSEANTILDWSDTNPFGMP